MAGGTEIGSLYYDLNIDDKNLHKQLDDADKSVKGFGDKVSAYWGNSVDASKKFALGIGAASAAVVAFGVSSIKEFTEQQDAIAGLNAGLKNTGENVGVVSQKLQEQAAALQRVTKFSDEQILSGDAMLTTFKLSGASIEKLNPALLDMAEGLRDVNGNTIGLDEGAKLMGKAMGNAAGGVDGLATALRRNGVIMTDAQKKIFSTGTEAQRTATLVQIMTDNFGGRAEAAGKTFSGQMKILSNQFRDLREQVGGVLVKALQPLINLLGRVTEKITKAGGLVKILTDFWEGHRQTIILVGAAMLGMLVPAFVTLAISAGEFVLVMAPWAALGVVVAVVIQKLADHMGGLAGLVQKARDELSKLGKIIKDEVVTPVQNLWKSFTENLLPSLKRLYDTLQPGLTELLKLFGKLLGAELIIAIKAFITWNAVLIRALGDVAAAISNVVQWLKDLWHYFEVAGQKIVDASTATKNGVVNAWQGVYGFFVDMFRAIKNTVVGTYDDILAVLKPWHENFNGTLARSLADANAAFGDYIKSTVSGWKDWAALSLMAISDGLISAGKAIGDFFSQIPGEVAYWLMEVSSAVINWGTSLVSNVSKTGGDAVSAIIKYFSNLPSEIGHQLTEVYNAIINFFTSLPGLVSGQAEAAGHQIGQSHVEGVSNALKSRDSIQKIGNAIIELIALSNVAAVVYVVNSAVILGGKIARGIGDGISVEVRLIRAALDQVINAVDGYFSTFYNSGLRLVQSLSRGIADGVKWAVDAAKGVLSKVRNLLPFSDAKEGPLSDLTLSGQRFSETFAKGIINSGGAIKDAVGNALSAPLTAIGGSIGVNGASALSSVPMGTQSATAGGTTTRYGDTVVNIGTIQDKSDADYILGRIDSNQRLQSRGVTPL